MLTSDHRLKVDRLPYGFLSEYSPILPRHGLYLRAPSGIAAGLTKQECDQFATGLEWVWRGLPVPSRTKIENYWASSPWKPHPLIDLAPPGNFLNAGQDWSVWSWQSRVFAALGDDGHHLVFHPVAMRMPGDVFRALVAHMASQILFHAFAVANPKHYWASRSTHEEFVLWQWDVDTSLIETWCAADGVPELSQNFAAVAKGQGGLLQGFILNATSANGSAGAQHPTA